MKANIRMIALSVIVQLACLGFLSPQPALAATNISSTYKYAWSENAGWQNWNASGCGPGWGRRGALVSFSLDCQICYVSQPEKTCDIIIQSSGSRVKMCHIPHDFFDV